MTLYIQVEKINGRNGLAELAEKLSRLGFEDTVLYNEGGWQDNSIEIAHPHLRFENEQDAVAYVLAFGGRISKVLPTYIIAGG